MKLKLLSAKPVFLVLLLSLCWAGGARAEMRRIYELPDVPYPEACLDRHVEGTVVLNFKVTSKGKIEDIKVTKEVTECPQFTTAALSAAHRAKVFPLPAGIHLLRQSIEVPITFTISQPES